MTLRPTGPGPYHLPCLCADGANASAAFAADWGALPSAVYAQLHGSSFALGLSASMGVTIGIGWHILQLLDFLVAKPMH